MIDHLLKFLEEIAAEPDPAKWINVPHVLEPPAYTMPPGGVSYIRILIVS